MMRPNRVAPWRAVAFEPTTVRMPLQAILHHGKGFHFAIFFFRSIVVPSTTNTPSPFAWNVRRFLRFGSLQFEQVGKQDPSDPSSVRKGITRTYGVVGYPDDFHLFPATVVVREGRPRPEPIVRGS